MSEQRGPDHHQPAAEFLARSPILSALNNVLAPLTVAVIVGVAGVLWDMHGTLSTIGQTVASHTDQFKELHDDHEKRVEDRVKQAGEQAVLQKTLDDLSSSQRNLTSQAVTLTSGQADLNTKADWLHTTVTTLVEAVAGLGKRLDSDEAKTPPAKPSVAP